MKTIILTLTEFFNFKNMADQLGIKFSKCNQGGKVEVTAAEDDLLETGFLSY